jgi:anti-anti-sigma factor
MSLKIALDEQSPLLTITLSGRLDSNTAPELDEVLNGVLTNTMITRLTFDLGQLVYLSSAGVRCFVRARKAIEPRGGNVVIVNPQPAVRKVLDIVKAIPPGGVFESVAELDAYLDHMQRKVREGT